MREINGNETRSRARLAAEILAVSAALGTFFAILGPFGSYRLGWPLVWMIWTGMMLAGALFAQLAIALMKWAAPAAGAVTWIGAVTALIAAPLTLLLIGVEAAFGGEIRFGGLPIKAFNVAIITLAIVWLSWLTEQRRRRASTAEPPSFLRRMPAKLAGGALYAVSAEDHYLRLHTSRGEDVILMRLSDAVAELQSIDGIRTHRSWWVAREGVDCVKKADGKLTIVLRSGAQAPVARAKASLLRAAGWI